MSAADKFRLRTFVLSCWSFLRVNYDTAFIGAIFSLYVVWSNHPARRALAVIRLGYFDFLWAKSAAHSVLQGLPFRWWSTSNPGR